MTAILGRENSHGSKHNRKTNDFMEKECLKLRLDKNKKSFGGFFLIYSKNMHLSITMYTFTHSFTFILHNTFLISLKGFTHIHNRTHQL